MDNLLSCSICKNHFTGPLILPCSHNFCSYCIRLQIQQNITTCPICNHDFKSSNNLIKNVLVEEIVQELKRVKNCQPFLPNPSNPLALDAIQKKESIELADKIPEDHSSTISLRPSRNKSRKLTDPSPPLNKDSIVKCPLCNAQVKEKHINTHMDQQCKTLLVSAAPTRIKINERYEKDDIDYTDDYDDYDIAEICYIDKAKKRKRNPDISPAISLIDDIPHDEKEDNRKPKPSVAYNLVKEKRLREILFTDGLSCRGDFSTLKARHKQWLIMYNSNLDVKLSLRKPDHQLLQELMEWENNRQQSAKVYTQNNPKFDVSNHLYRYKAEFEELIQSIRERKLKRLSIIKD